MIFGVPCSCSDAAWIYNQYGRHHGRKASQICQCIDWRWAPRMVGQPTISCFFFSQTPRHSRSEYQQRKRRPGFEHSKQQWADHQVWANPGVTRPHLAEQIKPPGHRQICPSTAQPDLYTGFRFLTKFGSEPSPFLVVCLYSGCFHKTPKDVLLAR